MQSKLMHSVTLCLLIIACVSTMVICRPSDPSTQNDDDANIDASEYYGDLSSETIRQLQKCDKDLDLMELCMRCAKVTKSQIVYPMCCGDEDNVQGWCEQYIYYGKRS